MGKIMYLHPCLTVPIETFTLWTNRTLKSYPVANGGKIYEKTKNILTKILHCKLALLHWETINLNNLTSHRKQGLTTPGITPTQEKKINTGATDSRISKYR